MVTKRTALYIPMDPALRDRCKDFAVAEGKTLKEWVLEAIDEKLERENLASPASQHARIYPTEGSLKEAIELSNKLAPLIQRGTLMDMDAARDINAMREERLKQILGE